MLGGALRGSLEIALLGLRVSLLHVNHTLRVITCLAHHSPPLPLICK